MRGNLPDKKYFIGKSLPTRPDITLVTWVASGNDAHLFRAHSTLLQRDLACKVIPRSNLVHGPDGKEVWRAEIHKANMLRNATVVKFESIEEWQDLNCIVLVAEFVEGPSLRQFLKDHRDEITISLILNWMATMLNLFHEMNLRGISHGDIHTGNILVEDRSSFDLVGPRYVFRVTDFGVAEATSDSRFKDDYLQLADVLSNLMRLVNYSSCSLKDKYFFNTLKNHFLARHLVETDLTLDPLARRPADLLKRLREVENEFERSAAQESANLLTPFDFLSCEQIGDAPALLHALYSDRFLGLPEIESQNNTVVTGPRGCGKTTVFRSLSLDHKMNVDQAVPTNTRYIGVYYECRDLYFAFPRYKLPTREEALDIPVHFITATLVSKLLDLLEGWARKHFEEEFSRIEREAVEDLWGILKISPPQSPNYATFKAVLAVLNKERIKAAEWHRFVNDPKRSIGQCFGPEVLFKVCEVLGNHFSFIRQRPIFFFIDDYSSPKVSKDLQANLNRIFMQRASVCFFKLSTESPVSFARNDVDGKIYVESREFILQNLGLVYLHAELEPKLTFIEDIFHRRLSESRPVFPVNALVDLVGSNTNQNNNEIARQIRNDEKPLFWGKEVLCKLCSGDIHYVIDLVGRMVSLHGGPQNLINSEGQFGVPPVIQNRAIREAAGGFLKNLRGIPGHGEKLVSIVEAFGNVSVSHLKYLESKNEENSPPKQATRVEPYEPFTLSQTAKQLYDELLRYSVFIEDYRGKSRRGNVVPRLYLRRFLIPHFNLTFSTRDSIELEPKEFEAFLLDPKGFEQRLRLKSADDAKRYSKYENEAIDQLSLGLEINTDGPHSPNS